MQTVFSNDMVAHVWAQQSQNEGRSNNGNFYFRDRVLYSYGSHYPVGVFAGIGGPVFLNSSKSSVTTESKHKSAARAALRHLTVLYMPELDEILDAINRAAANGGVIGGTAPEHHKRDVERYLAKHWRAIGADSDGAAWLLKAIGSRATWSAIYARHAKEADKTARTNAARLKAINVKAGRELAAQPWPVMLAEAWQGATDYSQRGLVNLIKDMRDARLATPKAHKRLRAELFRRETKLREIAAYARKDSHRGNAGERTQMRAMIGRLRRFKAGRIGHVPGFNGPDGPAKLEAALALPSGAGWRTLEGLLRDAARLPIHMPPAMRKAALGDLWNRANTIATEREGEETVRHDIASARRTVRESLERFNRARRTYRSCVASVTDNERMRLLHRIFTNAPQERPYGTSRGLDRSPSLASRAARIAARAAEIVADLQPTLDSLHIAWERAREAERIARDAERARIAAMSETERREAWETYELGSEHVADLQALHGPLLRAKAPVIDGCSVTGGTLETSMRAEVPLRHAFRVFQFVAACRADRKAWRAGGTWGPRSIRVGHFSVDRVDASGDFLAGCHSIKWGEVARLAERLGVADCLAPLQEATAELADVEA